MLTRRRSLLHLLLLLLNLPAATHAHESCCEAKRREMAALKQKPYILDEHATPPDIFDGEPRMVSDPDDEDELIPNPAYQWTPPMIPNPEYRPPRSLLTKVRGEVGEAVPWVTLGVLITATLDAIQLPLGKLQARLGHGSLLGAAIIGLLTPLCSCGSLPVARGFADAGVPLGTVVAFLTATQCSGIDSLAVTWGLLGRTAALFRLLGALLLAVAAGLAVPRRARTVDDSRRDGAPAARDEPPPAARLGAVATLRKAATTAVGVAGDVFPMVALGLLLSTAAVHTLPALLRPYEAVRDGPMLGHGAHTDDAHSADHQHHHNGRSGLDGMGSGSTGPLLARLLVLLAALPLQVCEHTSVTIAAGVQRAGGSPGLAFAFLLAAPSTNLSSLLVLLRSREQAAAVDATANDPPHAPRLAVMRVALALVLAPFLLSLAVDAASLDLLVEQEADGASSMPVLPALYTAASPWIAGALAVAAAARGVGGRVLSRKTKGDEADVCCVDPCCADKGSEVAPPRGKATRAKKVD